MNTTDYILAFSGTSVGGAIIGWWVNKKREDIEVTLKEQTFYKTLIHDIEEQRKKERMGYEKKVRELINEVSKLKEQIHLFIKQDENQKNNLAKWENYCEKLKRINDENKKLISKQYIEIEELLNLSKEKND